MSELIRDSCFGQIVRLLSRRRCFQYIEERDPSVWKRYIEEDMSANAAHHGTVGPPEEGLTTAELRAQGIGGVRTREARGSHRRSSTSSYTAIAQEGHFYNHASGVKLDPEKGKDIHVVSWFGDDDPEVGEEL